MELTGREGLGTMGLDCRSGPRPRIKKYKKEGGQRGTDEMKNGKKKKRKKRKKKKKAYLELTDRAGEIPSSSSSSH